MKSLVTETASWPVLVAKVDVRKSIGRFERIVAGSWGLLCARTGFTKLILSNTHMEQQLQSLGQTQNTPEKKAWYKKWWVITLAVIAVLYSIGSSAIEDTKQNANESEDVTQPSTEVNNPAETKRVETEKTIPEVSVTSANIAKDYSENEVAADAKYKGQLIEMSGQVASIDNGTFDNEMIVKLSDGQYGFSGPWCYMQESERDKVLAFKKDQQVILVGLGNSATIGSPMLKDCVVK